MRHFLRALAAIGIVSAALCGLSVLLLWFPEWMANQYQFEERKDWAGQVTANRAMLVNLLGGAAVAITIYFTYGNFKLGQQTLRVTEERLITDCFSKAIEALGNDDMGVRLGGIHALAKIARTSEAEYFPIVQGADWFSAAPIPTTRHPPMRRKPCRGSGDVPRFVEVPR